jgi:phosphatidylserine synthase
VEPVFFTGVPTTLALVIATFCIILSLPWTSAHTHILGLLGDIITEMKHILPLGCYLTY